MECQVYGMGMGLLLPEPIGNIHGFGAGGAVKALVGGAGAETS